MTRPEQLEDIAWLLGAHVVDGALSGSLARVTRLDDVARIRVSTRHVEAGQRRFSIAHELGHVVLGHNGVETCTWYDKPETERSPLVEQEANAFAAELLLPAAHVRPRCEVSPVHFGVVEEIARDFHTSLVATAIRFAELTSERVAVVCSLRGRVRWVTQSETFWPEIVRGKPLLPWSVAHQYFRTRRLPTGAEEIDATAWVDGDHLSSPAEIVEHAVEIPSIRGVLSLIWIPDSCGALAHRCA